MVDLLLIFRKAIYNDIYLVDTFFDAGGDQNFAFVACMVVSSWLWPAFFLPPFGGVHMVSDRFLTECAP